MLATSPLSKLDWHSLSRFNRRQHSRLRCTARRRAQDFEKTSLQARCRNDRRLLLRTSLRRRSCSESQDQAENCLCASYVCECRRSCSIVSPALNRRPHPCLLASATIPPWSWIPWAALLLEVVKKPLVEFARDSHARACKPRQAWSGRGFKSPQLHQY